LQLINTQSNFYTSVENYYQARSSWYDLSSTVFGDKYNKKKCTAYKSQLY